MYNEDVKKCYLQENEGMSSYNGLLAIFRASEPYENKLNKDLCNFTYEELIDVLIELNAPSTSSLAVFLSYLRGYINFCILNGESIDGINHTVELTGVNLSQFINQFKRKAAFITRKELEEIAKDILNPMDAVVLLGIFEGLTTKELSELRRQDILSNSIVCDERELDMSPLFLKYAREAANEKYFRNTNRPRPLEDTPYIIKKSASAISDDRSLIIIKRFAYIRKAGEIPAYLTIPILKRSGLRELILNRINNTGEDPSELLYDYKLVASELSRYGYTNVTKARNEIAIV